MYRFYANTGQFIQGTWQLMGFGILGGFWNQSSVDSKGGMYKEHYHFSDKYGKHTTHCLILVLNFPWAFYLHSRELCPHGAAHKLARVSFMLYLSPLDPLTHT
jgi:hypothetical protein